MKSRPFRRLLTVLAVACLLVPAWSFANRVILHFVADFDPPSSSSDAPVFLADGGVFVVQGPPGIFDIVVDGTGNGVLNIGPNAFPAPGTLVGTLDQATYNSTIDLDLTLTPGGGISDLILSLVDDTGGGMIDLEFEDEDGGKLTVDGVSLPLGGPGEGSGSLGPMAVNVQLKGSLLNVNSYQVTVSGSFGSQQLSGFLPWIGPLSLAKVKIARPAGAVNDTWTLDDLVVSSPYDPGLVVK